MHSPFSFGRTATDEAFTNRENEVRRLQSNFVNRVNTIIISPRRWGKSSLVERVAGLSRSKQTRFVLIDLFTLRTEEEFYNALANAVIRGTATRTEEWINMAKKFLKVVTPRFTVELGDRQKLDLSLDPDVLKKHYRELLDLPEKIAEDKKMNIVVCIDEFQNITSFANPLAVQKRLRSVWQQHQKVTYCLYGSKQNMMVGLFNHPGQPFYRFGELMFLQKISEPKWVSYIVKQFTRTGKKIQPALAAEISRLAKNHPYYVQQLAHLVWTVTATSAGNDQLQRATQELLEQNALLYSRETENLNNTELRLLRALAAGEKQLSSREVIGRYQLGTSAGVVKAKKSLREKELIDESESGLSFLDPMYELWFHSNMRIS